MVLLAFFILLTNLSCTLKDLPGMYESFASQTPKTKSELMVIIDEPGDIYNRIITGLHVASNGQYQLVKLLEENMAQTALFDLIMHRSPRFLVTLGPKAAMGFYQSNIHLAAAFTMVPEIENNLYGDSFRVGIRMIPDIGERIALIKELWPNLKSLGVFYRPNSSLSIYKELRKVIENESFDIVKIEVKNHNDVIPALMRAGRHFEVLLLLEDPLLLFEHTLVDLAHYCQAKPTALFGLDPSMVRRGALVSFGIDYYALGKELYELSLENRLDYRKTVLINPQALTLGFNTGTAKVIGLDKDVVKNLLKFASKKSIPVTFFGD